MCVSRWAFQANDRLFFDKTGHVAMVPLEQRRTVNSEWYTTICLPVVFQEIRIINRRRRTTLHHDNASSHSSAQTTTFLSTENIDLMSYPPYNPDLARMTSFYFRTWKIKWDTWRIGWCVQNACFVDTSFRVAKVLRQLVQTLTKVYRS